MKGIKIILPVILIGMLGISWFSFVKNTMVKNIDYEECIIDAENSIQIGLYEQAIESYKKSLKYKNIESTYFKIKEIYDVLYVEEHTSFIRGLYLEDMAEASTQFPRNAVFWETQADLYLDALNYAKAFSVVKKGLNYGAKSEKLNKLHESLLYMVKTDYKLYYDYKTALNGYISVYDGNKWVVLDEGGHEITSKYKLIGLINDEGKGVYINDIDTRIMDADEITRARFDINVEDAGYYNEKSGFVPVKVNDKWRYMNKNGDFLKGEYEIAGSFYDGEAVACMENKWFLIYDNGDIKPLSKLENIKLDLYGCHIQNGIVIAQENGVYHFYNENFEIINEFEADDMDINIDGKVAFKKGERWGFVDTSGKVIIEPKYIAAKSFANGYAAVCGDENLWGFLNNECNLVIDYQFKGATYFNSNETCLISTTDGTVQLMYFMFN